MNQITTQYVTEGGACYEQYVITDPAAKTALTITPERGGMITGFSLNGEEYIWTRIGDNVLLIAGTVFGDITGGDLIHSSVLLMFLVLCQFFKIIINAIADEIFYDPADQVPLPV